MTAAEFARLPALVSRAEFQAWTGLSDEDLKAAVRSGEIQRYRVGNGHYHKYYKSDIGKMCGFTM